MNIGNYIHQLLLENDLVIIPGFGAFVSIYKSAQIVKDTNELKPPSKEISFNQQIRNNDALLVGRVAEGEVISHFDALKLIEKERENIIYQLDKGQKVYLEETGELFINENNEIQLEPIQDENLLLDSFGLESVSIKEVIEEKTIPIENKIETEIEEPPKEEQVIELEEKPDPEPISIPITNNEPDKKEKKKRSWLWVLLILAPIIVVGIYITTNKTTNENPPTKISNKIEETIENKPILKADTTIIDSIPELSKDSVLTEEIKTPTIETIESDSPKYILVGGSFKAQENAENYLIELKGKGFDPFHLGKRGNFYIVGIGKYNSEKEALTAKRNFSEENPNSGIWIYEEKTK
ncbi:MAG: SPOR domain-containing protein [Bacteroidetes bacterium]|nr:SPOR domain-containing protein [Bacteroidota bacterium]